MAGPKLACCALVLALVAICPAYGSNNYTTVTTESGQVRGVVDTAAGSVARFLGIPYVEPPTGRRRFKPPVPVTPWTETLQATEHKPSCLQQPVPALGLQLITSEDCLYLNVYTPGGASGGGTPKAVLVYIHGGSFLIGSGTLYDGTRFVNQGDIVFVSLSYRLGIFGTFAYPDVGVKGNLGLLDQVEALKWIKKNIGVFGGDPDKITVWGLSAGSMSLSLHMVSPLTKGLFHRVILESGSSIMTGFNQTASISDMVGLVDGIAQQVGCTKDSAQEMFACLQDADGKKILNSPQFPMTGYSIMRFIDGKYLPDTPVNIMKAGKFATDVDVLIGGSTDEGDTFIFDDLSVISPDFNEAALDEKILEFARWQNKFRVDVLHPVFSFTYLPSESTPPEADYLKAFVEVGTDTMRMPIIQEALYYANKSAASVYMYRFSYRPSWSVGPAFVKAGHLDFSALLFPPAFLNLTANEVILRDKITAAWVRFVKSGNPGEGQSFTWPQFSNDKKQLTDIVASGFVNGDLKVEERKRKLWSDVIYRVREEEIWCKPPPPKDHTSDGMRLMPAMFCLVAVSVVHMCRERWLLK